MDLRQWDAGLQELDYIRHLGTFAVRRPVTRARTLACLRGYLAVEARRVPLPAPYLTAAQTRLDAILTGTEVIQEHGPRAF